MYALKRRLFATLIVVVWVTVSGCGNRFTKDPDFDNPITLDQDSEPVQKDKKRLKGRWNVASDSMDLDTGETFEFREDRVIVSRTQVTYRFSIDPTKTPPRMDMFYLREDGTEPEIPLRGIYSLDEGNLTISLGGWGPSAGDGDPFRRADTFAAAGEQWWILELQREQ